MKTQASKPAPAPKTIDVEPAKVSTTTAPAPAVDEKSNRISIPLGKDGKIDWDSMRSGTKEKVKLLMGGTTEATPAPAPAPKIEVFDPAWTGTLFDTIGKIEAFAATKMYKMSPEIADRCFTFTTAEKDKLSGPTAKVINKYAPEWLEKFKDEIALAMLFVTMTAVKFQMAAMLMKTQGAAESMRERAKPPVENKTEAPIEAAVS